MRWSRRELSLTLPSPPPGARERLMAPLFLGRERAGVRVPRQFTNYSGSGDSECATGARTDGAQWTANLSSSR